MSDSIEQKLRRFIALSATPATGAALLDALLAEVEQVRRAWKDEQDAWVVERDRLNSQLEAGRARESAARDAAREMACLLVTMTKGGACESSVTCALARSGRFDGVEECALCRARTMLRATHGTHGVDLDAECGCGHVSIGVNNLCAKVVWTAGGSIASCGCSHPSHAMPAKAKPPLRENGCHPWCTVTGPHTICVSDPLPEGPGAALQQAYERVCAALYGDAPGMVSLRQDLAALWREVERLHRVRRATASGLPEGTR